MLVLTRKIGESIFAGDVAIHIGDLRPSHIRLAIDAPPDVSMLRDELIDFSGDDPDLASKPAEWSPRPAVATRDQRLHIGQKAVS